MSTITPLFRFTDITGMLKRNLQRGFRYSVSGVVGFLFFETTLYLGLHMLTVRNIVYIDLAAALLSTSVTFLLNEYWTFCSAVKANGAAGSPFKRLLVFQGVNAAGNVIIIGLQLLLLKYIALEPIAGTLVASIVATPFDYYLSSVIVWKVGI